MSGSLIWHLQRWSAVIIFIYLIYLLSFFISTHQINFEIWNIFVQTLVFKISTSIVFCSIIIHSFIGLWTVGTDYLTPRVLGFINLSLSKIADISRFLFNFFFSALGLILYIYLLFLIWA